MVLSEPEFLLGSSYALWRALLEVKASVRGLSDEETSAHGYLRDALPDPYPLPLELAEYLSHLGEFTTASGARVSPDFVLPRCAGEAIAGTTEATGSWSCMHQPLFHSLTLALHSGTISTLQTSYYHINPFTRERCNSTMPGASIHTPLLESRKSGIAMLYRPIWGPSEQARFQVFPELLATYCGVVSTLECSRRTARASSSRAGSQAQEVVSLTTGYTHGKRETGYTFRAADKLPPAAIQAGRLFRYQRLTPVELTYSGLAADANWAYERSSAQVKPCSETQVESMMHFWVACAGYAITFRQPTTRYDANAITFRQPTTRYDADDSDDDDFQFMRGGGIDRSPCVLAYHEVTTEMQMLCLHVVLVAHTRHAPLAVAVLPSCSALA